MLVTAYNVLHTRVVVRTTHPGHGITEALDAAEVLARKWNRKEKRADMVVTALACDGHVRTLERAGTLGAAILSAGPL